MSTLEVANVVNHSQSAETEQQMGKANDVARWSLTKRIIFRFVFSYLFIYIFPFPLDSIPFMEFLTQRYNDLWNTIVPWTGKHILRLSYDITVLPNGSGDTTYSYVQILCCFTLAVAVTVIWTLFDRR